MTQLEPEDAATMEPDDVALWHLSRALSLIHGAREGEAGAHLALALAFVGLDSAVKVTISVTTEVD